MKAQDQDPITATINVSIVQFRALGGVFPISALMSLAQPAPPQVTINDGSITVTGTDPVTLIFQFATNSYLFVGASFNTKTPIPDMGTTEFPTVTINRNPVSNQPGNCLAILDANLPGNEGKSYSYVILVQKASTAEIGLIDPAIVNDPH